jgi:pimeloyl-ACP methyl ester carboxylesterase
MKRFLKWFLVLLIAALIALFAWGYAPDSDPVAMRAKYTNAASRFVEVEPGLSVHVRDEGKRDGPVLVLVHGSNASLQTWEPWVARLGSTYRIISMDTPGHGLTGPHPRGVYQAADYVQMLDTLTGKLGITKFALAGNSMGGWISWNYLLSHGDKLTALVLVDAGGAPNANPPALPIGYRLAYMPVVKEFLRYITPRSVIEKSIRQTLFVQAPIDDKMIDRYWEMIRYPGNRIATGPRLATKRAIPTKEQFSNIKTPTLVMWGDKDSLVPVSAADWFTAAIPGAQKIIYPSVGHIPMEEVPDQSAKDLGVFLSKALKI